MHQVGKALGGGSGRIALHNAGLRVGGVCNTNHRFKGFAFVVRGVVRGRDQLPHHIPELLCLFGLLLLLFRLLLFRCQRLLAGERKQPHGAHQRCQEQIPY